MQILPNQAVIPETRVDSGHPIVQALIAAGAKKPKVVLVFDSNEGAPDAAQNKWKVRVFYDSPTDIKVIDLTKTLLMDTKIMPEGDDVVRTIYPDGYVGWCGVINGQAIWIT